MGVKGYKISDNGKCRDIFYEVGKSYKLEGKLEICKSGFHFCKNPDDVFNYYVYQKGITKIFEVEVLGEVIDKGDKSVTDELKILREIPLSEYNDLFNRCKFDDWCNIIYCEYSDGYWEKWKYDDRGNMIYCEYSNGDSWYKKEYDDRGNISYRETSNGYWEKRQCDDKGNETYYENSNGYWVKKEYDDKGNRIYYENSDGFIWGKEE